MKNLAMLEKELKLGLGVAPHLRSLYSVRVILSGLGVSNVGSSMQSIILENEVNSKFT